METIIEHNRCTGCKACENVCSFGAICFECDSKGFWYPNIDEEKCTNCGACVAICPQKNKHNTENSIPRVYSAWNRDDSIRMKSTSGGVFYALAKTVISQGGVVVGCAYGKDYKSAYHKIVDKLEDLEEIVGSKYFQSDTNDVYKRVMEFLKQDKLVFFTGTPCQISAMKMIAGEMQRNLITMDFICLGINSPLAFKSYVEEQEEKHKSKVKLVQLKNKINGWESLGSYMEFENGKTFLADKNQDWWIKGYIKENLYMRSSCYDCIYRTIPRTADITVGDFWGITGVSKKDIFKGVSIILTNSEKGKLLLKDAKEELFLKETTLEKGEKGNPALFNNPLLSNRSNVFFRDLKKYPFSKAVRRNSQEQKKINLDTFKFDKINIPIEKLDVFVKENPLAFLRENGYIGKVDISSFIKLNYFYSNIVRDRNVYVIPYLNSIIDIDPTAKLFVRRKHIEIGINKLKRSKAETLVRLGKKAVWVSNNGAGLFYNTVLDLCKNAKFESGFFTANGGCAIVCAKHIVFGDDVMLGRNIIIYDSDHHQIMDENNNVKNHSKEVIIEDHVWLTSNVTVLKGSHIEKNSIIGGQTVITDDIPQNALVVGGSKARIINQKANWSRKTVI